MNRLEPPTCFRVCNSQKLFYFHIYSYLEQHYGDVHLSVPNFQCEFARFAINAAKTVGVSMNRVLDVGCGPGRTTFELARGFQVCKKWLLLQKE